MSQTAKTTEENEVQDAIYVNTTKKKQAKSVSYALEAIKVHMMTIADAGLLTNVEFVEMDGYRQAATRKYLNEKYGI